MPGPNPQRRANGIIGQGVRLLDHRGLYGPLAGTDEPPRLNPRAMFAAFALDLTAAPESQVFLLPVQQPRLVQVLAQRADEHGVDLRWGHALSGFDQDDDGVTVHVTGPDGPYELRTRYLVGADGGTSMTRKLAGIDFPGMSSYDVVVRMGFDVLPPQGWVDPVSGVLDIPGFGRVPPLQFHRTERGVFAYGALGGRSALIVFELDRSAREDSRDDTGDGPPMSMAELEAAAKRVIGADVLLRPASQPAGEPLDLRRFSGINSRIASAYQSGRVILVGDAAHVHSPMGGPGLNLGLQDAVNLGWKLGAVLRGGVGAGPARQLRGRAPARSRTGRHAQPRPACAGPAGTGGDGPTGAVRRIGRRARGRPSPGCSGIGSRKPLPHRPRRPSARRPLGARFRRLPRAGRVAELARDGRPLLIDLTEGGVVAAAMAEIARQVTVAAGQPVGEVAATAVLVRPDGYVAWASSTAAPGGDELGGLRDALRTWFGICAATSS